MFTGGTICILTHGHILMARNSALARQFRSPNAKASFSSGKLEAGRGVVLEMKSQSQTNAMAPPQKKNRSSGDIPPTA